MRYFKFVLIVAFILIFFPLSGCELYNKDGVYYYENLQDALYDINGECVGKRDQSVDGNPSVVVTLNDGTSTICLLKDVTMDDTILLNNTNFNFNGFVLRNNKATLIITYGNCRIYNGFLYRLCEGENGQDGIVVSRNSICHIENIVFESDSSSCINIAIHVYGEMFMTGSTVKVSSLESDQNTVTVAIYGNIFSNVYIDGSDIIAKSDFGRVDGVYVGDVGKLVNSHIVAYANYQSNETRFTSCAIGCNNDGTLVINNCNIYGVHSGIDSHGDLFVDAGIYRGYGHGGIYCSGANRTYRIANATILQAEMPIGYTDIGVGCMMGGIYIGGGENKDNINVFIDNCVIKAAKNPIVLRGTNGEKNNSLYISNTVLDVRHVRVDNDTHRVYIGNGCNFEELHVDIPEVVVYTNVDYTQF